jgi:hypothetical protein
MESIAESMPFLQKERGIHLQVRDNSMLAWGVGLLVGTFLFFVTTMYTVLLSKFMPDTGNQLLDWIKHDQYYCHLVPALIPVSFIIVYFNWVGFKFFRHNS